MIVGAAVEGDKINSGPNTDHLLDGLGSYFLAASWIANIAWGSLLIFPIRHILRTKGEQIVSNDQVLKTTELSP